ncbi:peptide deformylase [Blautia schinkii]|nr:peptide deformylase [Blautia schinkii]
MKREILLLGNEELYEVSAPVEEHENVSEVITDLHDTLMAFREKYHAGRAIAAPQIGVKKRMIYMFIDEPTVFINPVIEFPDEELMEVLDDCMSFPGLYVRVNRHKRCTIKYFDENWNRCELHLEGDLSELLQHEYDHLDGILATMRAIDNKSLKMKF